MNKLSPERKRILFLFIMIIVGSIFTIVYLAATGNTNQVYNDIIVEYTSIFSSNKSAERNLLFGLIFAGIVIYAIYFLITKKKWNVKTTLISTRENESEQKSREFVCALIAMTAIYLIIYGGSYQIIVASLLYTMILYIVDRNLIYTGICTFYIGAYAFIGLFRLYVYRGGENSINNMVIAGFAFLVSLIPLVFSDRKKTLLRTAMIESVFIPCALLLYLSDRYKSGEDFVTVDVPNQVKYVIVFIIFIFIIEALFVLIETWKIAEKIDDIITIGSCVTIMAFNRFDGTGAIMSTDMHHPFENIIGFSQIFELGQIPFKNYVPISGMYSIVQGAIFDWFGDGGTFANYHITNNLFYLFIIILIVILLKVQLDGAHVFLISLIFYVQSYNRLAFMLPIMLLLINPKLIERKNAWLVTWFITSLFQGLYYPLYGVATCIAFFPLLVWQIITFIISGELKKSIKTAKFWIGWGICLVLLFVCTGYLLGTLKHMLAMSNQSLLADGISRFGQLLPGWFFPFLGDGFLAVKIGLYYIFTIMVPVSFVWIAFALAIKVANISFEEKKIQVENVKSACIVTSVVIMPIICYTFTFTRLDIDGIYARSTSVLFTGMILVLIFVWNYIRHEKLRLCLVFFMISIPAVVNTEGVFTTDYNSKLATYYTVPDEYMYVEDDTVEKLGTGFIYEPIYNAIVSAYAKYTSKDQSLSYIGDPSEFGYYYLLGIKGDGAIELNLTVKSYSAAKETVEIARANNSIIGATFIPFYNYYLYHWLLASGEYYWDAGAWQFIPNNKSYTHDEIIEQNKNNEIAWNDMDLGKTASSWGSSISSLEKLFTDPNITYNIRSEGNGVIVDFIESFDGDTADFLYLDFADMETNYEYTLYNLSGEFAQKESSPEKFLMKKNYNPNMTVQIRWQDDNKETHTINCKMSKGKLLIPLGAGAKWLFNQHNNISIYVYQSGNEITIPTISEIRMLKLQEID